MAPDAPAPRYNDQGRPLGDWLVVLRYDALRDALTLSWTQDATPWQRRGQGAVAHPGDEVQALLDDARRTVERMHQPRLF